MEEFTVKTFDELTLGELYEILKIRSEVFIVEQDCVYLDPDGLDEEAIHLWMKVDGHLVGYARVLKPGTYLREVAIGRVLTLERGKGYGQSIFLKALEVARKRLGARKVEIRAQEQAEGFYIKCGFRRISAPFMYEGLMHLDMAWEG